MIDKKTFFEKKNLADSSLSVSLWFRNLWSALLVAYSYVLLFSHESGINLP